MMDTEKAFKQAEKYLDEAVKSGRLPYEEAARIHREAKKNYRDNAYDRQAERIERETGKRV